MIVYTPGKWNIAFAFSLRGSVFPKAVVWALPCSIIAVGLHFVINAYPEMFSDLGAGDVGASVLSGFTFVLGFLVVFRSQQAYSRWWEGGTLLQQIRGEWFNAYSCLLAFCNRSETKTAEVQEFQHRLVRLMSLLYYNAMQQISTKQTRAFLLIDVGDFDHESLQYMMESHDGCEVCLQWIQRLVAEASDRDVLTVAPPILSRVYNQLGNGIVNLSNARKIRDFPIPFPVAQMITLMLLVHWMITAFICAACVDRPFWAALLSFIVTLSFWSIHYISIELEQPFGDDANDLPLHEMQEDMHESLVALLDRCAQSPPRFRFSHSEHAKLISTRATPKDVVEGAKQKRPISRERSSSQDVLCPVKSQPRLPADRPVMLPRSVDIDGRCEADVGQDHSVAQRVERAQPEGHLTSSALRQDRRSIERGEDPAIRQRSPQRGQPEERPWSVLEGNGCSVQVDDRRRVSKPMVPAPLLPHQVDAQAARWVAPLPSTESCIRATVDG